MLEEVASIAFANFADFVKDEEIQSPDQVDRNHARVIKGFKKKTRKTTFEGETTTEVVTEITLHDKLKALEILTKHLGIDKPKQEAESDSGSLNSLITAINKSRND